MGQSCRHTAAWQTRTRSPGQSIRQELLLLPTKRRPAYGRSVVTPARCMRLAARTKPRARAARNIRCQVHLDRPAPRNRRRGQRPAFQQRRRVKARRAAIRSGPNADPGTTVPRGDALPEVLARVQCRRPIPMRRHRLRSGPEVSCLVIAPVGSLRRPRRPAWHPGAPSNVTSHQRGPPSQPQGMRKTPMVLELERLMESPAAAYRQAMTRRPGSLELTDWSVRTIALRFAAGGTECKLTQANNEAVAIPAKTSIDRGRRGIGRDVIDPWPSGDRSFGGSREADPAGCPRADVGGRLLLAENRHAIS